MTIENFDDETRNISSLNDSEKQRAKDFLQGLVYCWCKNQPDEKFAAKDLVGDENKNWKGTPLQQVYDYYLDHYKKNGKSEKEAEDAAYKQAPKDVGWLLKSMLHADKREFKQIDEWVNSYKWLNK